MVRTSFTTPPRWALGFDNESEARLDEPPFVERGDRGESSRLVQRPSTMKEQRTTEGAWFACIMSLNSLTSSILGHSGDKTNEIAAARGGILRALGKHRGVPGSGVTSADDVRRPRSLWFHSGTQNEKALLFLFLFQGWPHLRLTVDPVASTAKVRRIVTMSDRTRLHTIAWAGRLGRPSRSKRTENNVKGSVPKLGGWTTAGTVDSGTSKRTVSGAVSAGFGYL